MSDKILDLLNSIKNNQAIAIKKLARNEIANKTTKALDAKKDEMAKDLFNVDKKKV
jgi:hypothetical protein